MNKLSLDDFLEDDVPEGWKVACISIHSHWLTKDEASDHWMSFVSISGLSDPNWDSYQVAENNFINFFKYLESEFELYIFRQNINSYSIETISDDIESSVIKNVREDRFDAYFSDILGCVVLGDFDFTFPMYIRIDKSWESIQSAASKFDLYLLK
jgi:hypothetical protein